MVERDLGCPGPNLRANSQLSQTETESVIIVISCDEIILNAYNINVLVGASVILQFP